VRIGVGRRVKKNGLAVFTKGLAVWVDRDGDTVYK
jgi:hypothetical protein